MPRAHRYFLPHHVWHITHRCHERQFLLKFVRDRRRWMSWLFEAKKRFGLCVLDYVVTSNHIHLLVHDQGRNEIAQSMQLIAGRTAQEYNRRKGRKGAFWEDRYHATAVDTDAYLARCLVYIDLNMVRAGAVRHPGEWDTGGYREIQSPRRRYAIVDLPALIDLLGMNSLGQLQAAHADWIAQALQTGTKARDPLWSESLAVGGEDYVQNVQRALGVKARYRDVSTASGAHVLREPDGAYAVYFGPENGDLRGKASASSR
jgi:putative transposase